MYARKDYVMEREAKSGKGYCDYLFLPKKTGKPAITLELKVDVSCQAALAQIKEKIIWRKQEDIHRISCWLALAIIELKKT